jgi:AraC-like DNA-binding protein
MFVVFGLGAFQAFLFSILLLIKKEKKPADKFLAGFFFVICLYLSIIYSVKFSLWQKYPDIILIHTFVSLTYGPLLYFYVISLIGQRITMKQLLIHSIPILGIFLLILPFIFHDTTEKWLYFTDKFINLPLNVSIGTFIQHLSAPIYFIWIINILNGHKEYLKNTYSSTDKISLNWMRKLLYGVISIWLIDCINVYALNFTNFDVHFSISWIIKFCFIAFIILIGFYGINQGSIFATIRPTNEKEDTSAKDSKKIISDELAKEHTDTLIRYMHTEKPFLNSEIRIQDIAISLQLPVHVLSHVINTKLHQNFYDFVNTYRINEAKFRLHDEQYIKLTIIAIAFDCGFNSKATFNRLFKQYTGVTPSQYKMNKLS